MLAGAVWVLSERLLFPVPPPGYRSTADLVRLRTSDGEELAAVYLPRPGARHTILLSHGNGEDLGDLRPLLETFRDAGFSVLAYDYRGYGLSSGRPSERGIVLDLEAAYEHLTGTLGTAPAGVVLYGRSLGSGPSVDLAARRPVGGLILESGFATAFTVVTRWPLFPFDRFRSARLLRRVRCPVLVIHGTEDRIVPFRHGLRLYAAAPGEREHLWIEGAGHNDLWSRAGGRILAAVRAFAERLAANGETHPAGSGSQKAGGDRPEA